jgi:hypothetical protein
MGRENYLKAANKLGIVQEIGTTRTEKVVLPRTQTEERFKTFSLLGPKVSLTPQGSRLGENSLAR